MSQASLARYAVVTGSYWSFTLTDGALRMLVVLYFHQLGYSPLQVALLFVLYELFSILTNLLGGWLGARIGLVATLVLGLSLQVVALLALTVDDAWLTVPYVMCAQALSGVAKDLSKMSAKSSVKRLVEDGDQHQLYRWVAILTGSKNTLKGIGFFVGGALLAVVGFRSALLLLAALVGAVAVGAWWTLGRDPDRVSFEPKFRDLFSKSAAINRLSAARLFLFGARDIWFVVAVPVYLQTVLGWTPTAVGALLALWVMLYGVVQGSAPWITRSSGGGRGNGSAQPGRQLAGWGGALCAVTAVLLIAEVLVPAATPLLRGSVLVLGLLLFGATFAVNSALHSYLVVAYAEADSVALDVGFYYMSNAAGRLTGTLLSGGLYQLAGLPACLLGTLLFLGAASLIARLLPPVGTPVAPSPELRLHG
ncbi:MAG: organoarsenical effux MFS transporter ArsJ [Pseudomonadota bacterium]